MVNLECQFDWLERQVGDQYDRLLGVSGGQGQVTLGTMSGPLSSQVLPLSLFSSCHEVSGFFFHDFPALAPWTGK